MCYAQRTSLPSLRSLYDKGGNISSKKAYAYTTGIISTDPVDTITYKYSESNWKDLLTSYNGQTITYDEVGNPLKYREGMNFTWKNVRSLATASTSAGDSIIYQYNKDGIKIFKE